MRGVSDAEMAGTLGIQRETIFRWRAGSPPSIRAAPRTMLRLAVKLRLTATERDELLLAAGFLLEIPPDLHRTYCLPVLSLQTVEPQTLNQTRNYVVVEQAGFDDAVIGRSGADR